MTFQELHSLRYIEMEIEEYREKIVELRELAESITPSLSGMPNCGASDKVGQAATEIAYYIEMLEAAILEHILESRRIHDFIMSVEDSQLRLILHLRFVKCRTWQYIAQEIGGGNSADGVRKRCSRYIRASEKIEKN